MNSKQRRTLEAIFETPTRANLNWLDIENLLLSVGADITEGAGSRVRVSLNGFRYVYHRPHPGPTTVKGAVESVREQLIKAGIRP